MTNGSKRKILIITPYMPFPLDSGGKIAQFEINDALREYLDITLVFPLGKDNSCAYEELVKKWPDVSFKPYRPNRWERIQYFWQRLYTYGMIYRVGAYILQLCKGSARGSGDFFIVNYTDLYKSECVSRGLVRHVNNILNSAQFELVQVEFTQYLPLARFIKPEIKRIFVHHELGFVRGLTELNVMERPNSILKKLWERNTTLELRRLSVFDLVIVLSNSDKDKLLPYLRPEKVLVSPLVIRAYADVTEESFEFGGKLVFVGGQGHMPNSDGLRWFLINCWTDLRELYPGLELSVIGKWNGKSLEWAQRYPGLSFKGFEPDLKRALKGGISIVPIRIGSGVRMKILDTVNSRIPFVTTTIGVEGLGFQNGRDCIIADSPALFVQGIKKIIDNKELGAQLVKNASLLIENELSYDSVIETRRSGYDK